MKTVVVANNQWDNIGNAFFMNAIVENLREAYEDRIVAMSGEEAPVHYNSKWNGNHKSIIDYSVYTKSDWFVISGPRFNKNIRKKFEKLFSALKDAGTKIVLISVGSNRYDQEEIEFCRKFLTEYPPYILSTRDSETYHNYADLAEYAYDGICSAFYASFYYPGYDTPQLEKYITFGFDTSSEPQFYIDSDRYKRDGLVSAIQVDWSTSKTLSSFELVLDNFKEHPTQIQEWKLIRPMHSPVAKFGMFAYNRPNQFVSLNPYAYLNLFRNTELTVSERVHACVATLSYQKPAMLCKKTKRSLLFDRLGLGEITQRPVCLSRETLIAEKEKFIDFLKSVPL